MIQAQTKNINESKLKTRFKPMIKLDKNRNFYTCACKTNFVIEGSKNKYIYTILGQCQKNINFL